MRQRRVIIKTEKVFTGSGPAIKTDKTDEEYDPNGYFHQKEDKEREEERESNRLYREWLHDMGTDSDPEQDFFRAARSGNLDELGY